MYYQLPRIHFENDEKNVIFTKVYRKKMIYMKESRLSVFFKLKLKFLTSLAGITAGTKNSFDSSVLLLMRFPRHEKTNLKTVKVPSLSRTLSVIDYFLLLRHPALSAVSGCKQK